MISQRRFTFETIVKSFGIFSNLNFREFIFTTMNTIKLYKFVNSSYGLSNLRERKIKISRLEDLNDPFELRAIRSLSCEIKQLLENERKEFSEKYGLLCFCKDWRSPVLWAHYAENHQGLCFGFEICKEFVGNVGYVEQPINADDYFEELIANSDEQKKKILDYIDKSKSYEEFKLRYREVIEQVTEENLKSVESDEKGRRLLEKILLTKFSHWSYEREYRLFPELNQDFCVFTSDTNDDQYNIKLIEVIIGLNSSLSLNAVQNALGDSFEYVKIFKSDLHDEKFEMKRTQLN